MDRSSSVPDFVSLRFLLFLLRLGWGIGRKRRFGFIGACASINISRPYVDIGLFAQSVRYWRTAGSINCM